VQRDWRDPRDGSEWLLTLTPFGSRVSSAGTPRGLTISFHRPGHTPQWTAYSLAKPLLEAGDSELIDLLEAARRTEELSERRVRHRRSSA
jgi:hypothetical protein